MSFSADPGWNTNLSSQDFTRFGSESLDLVTNGAEWIIRRVDSVTMLDETNVRQQVSVDFRLPTNLTPARTFGTNETFFVPLTFLERRTDLNSFNVCDESGASVPLLTRRDNSQITGAALVTMARRLLAPNKPGPALTAFLASIPTRPVRAVATKQFGSVQLARWILNRDRTIFNSPQEAETLLGNNDFLDLLGLCVYGSILHVALLASPGDRRILKVSWTGRWGNGYLGPGERIKVWLGWEPDPRYLPLSHVGGSGTQHIQFIAPSGLEFTHGELLTGPPRDRLPDRSYNHLNDPDYQLFKQRKRGLSPYKHLYIDQSHRLRMGFALVTVRVSRNGFFRAAVLTGVLLVLLLAAFAWRAPDMQQNTETAAALVLLVPATIAGYLAAPGEHPMSKKLLRGPRALAAGLGLLAAGAVSMLVLGPDDNLTLRWIWGGEAVLCLTLTLILVRGLR